MCIRDSIFHFFQSFNRKISSFLGLIDFITPILAFIFIKQIIVIFSGSFIKLPFVLKCLCFTALITAQFITLAFCQKIFSTDFALTETKAPVSYTHLDVYKRQDWRISTALITGFMAKESVVSTLSILFGNTAALLGSITSLSAASLLAFCLLYTPCVAAIASIKRELGGKWAIFVVLAQCVIAWLVSFAVYLVGGLFF